MTEYLPNLSATLRPMTQRLRGRPASRAEAAPFDPAPECGSRKVCSMTWPRIATPSTRGRERFAWPINLR